MLFSILIVLGAATRLGSAPARWPRFAIAELHRTALFAVALLALHVLTAILDPYVTIGWAATVLPPASPYRPIALSFGALAVDLAGAVLVTRPRPSPSRAPLLAHSALARLPGLARGLHPLTDRRKRPVFGGWPWWSALRVRWWQRPSVSASWPPASAGGGHSTPPE